MMIWAFVVGNLSKIGIGIFGAIGLFLYGKNSKLAHENTKLQQDLKAGDKIIDIQQKVLHVTQSTSATDLDGNLQRMRDGKL